MRVFVLEDDPLRIQWFRERFIGHDLTLAESVSEALEKFTGGYTLACLDHDLGGQQMVDSEEENTGAEFVRLKGKEFGDHRGVVIVHSYNPVGAAQMVSMLEEVGADVVYAPFRGPTFTRELDEWVSDCEAMEEVG